MNSMETTTGMPHRARLRLVSPAYPAFNIYSRLAKETTPLGPVCIATAVNDIPGWDAEVIDENNYRFGPRDADGKCDHAELQRLRPAKVVGLYGGLTSTIPRLLQLAQRYKAMGVHVIAGGQHFVEDNVEHALRNGVDVVALGEGEQTITELIAYFEQGGDLSAIQGIAFLKDDHLVLTPRREPIRDFDQLPIPDFSTLRYAKMIFFPVSGTRGCGMDCEFCSVKGKPRFAAPERMMEQFTSIYERWGRRVFFIVDDLFGQNRAETLRLCQLLHDYQKRMDTRFSITVQIRLDKARDEELLTAMRQAGVNVLAIGFESPIAEELEAMSKHLKPQDMLDLVKLYRQAGFRIHGMFIFGYPSREGQPFHMPAEERVKHFRRFIRKAKIDTVQVLQPIPLPGTALTARLAAQGRIFSTDLVGLEYYDGNFPIIQPDEPLTPEEMQAAAHKIMGHFYRPRSMFHVGLNILLFPYIAFRLHRLDETWRRWYRKWSKDLYRTGGWLTLRQWTAAFRKDGFAQKLAAARGKMHPPRSNPNAM